MNKQLYELHTAYGKHAAGQAICSTSAETADGRITTAGLFYCAECGGFYGINYSVPGSIATQLPISKASHRCPNTLEHLKQEWITYLQYIGAEYNDD